MRSFDESNGFELKMKFCILFWFMWIKMLERWSEKIEVWKIQFDNPKTNSGFGFMFKSSSNQKFQFYDNQNFRSNSKQFAKNRYFWLRIIFGWFFFSNCVLVCILVCWCESVLNQYPYNVCTFFVLNKVR